jgi:hypothetical protein
MGFAPAWSAKFEYLFLGPGTTSATLFGTTVNARAKDHILRTGINYRFLPACKPRDLRRWPVAGGEVLVISVAGMQAIWGVLLCQRGCFAFTRSDAPPHRGSPTSILRCLTALRAVLNVRQ